MRNKPTIETQLAADSSKYGSANPKLQDDRASLAGVTAAVKEEIKRIGERAESDYRAAQITESNMQAVYQHQRAAADQLNNKAVEYSIAKQQAAESRELYETLYQHLKEAGVIEGLRSSNVTVVDPGASRQSPPSPTFRYILAFHFFGGLFFGSVGALFLDSIDDRVQSMEMIERSLNTPLLGVIPERSLLAGVEDLNFHPLNVPNDCRTEYRSSTAADAAVPAPEASNTAFSESLRSLRTALLLSRSSAPPKVILITSAAEGEGKTTISLHLAAALVRNHSKVLLVEADMRCPTLSSRLSISGDRGLSNMLSGDPGEPGSQAFCRSVRIWRSFPRAQLPRIQLSYLAQAG